jgi:hypothetical protein
MSDTSPRARAALATPIALVLALLLAPTPARAAGDDDPARLARLAAGVQAEEGIRAIKRLQNSYAHFQEAGLWDDLSELFATGATAEFPGEHLSGKRAIGRHLRDAAGSGGAGLGDGQLNVHLILQPIVTLSPDGRHAKGTWHEMALLGQYGKSASWVGAIQENDYVLERGVWKIGRLRWLEQYRGAYDDYGHKAPPRWNIPYHFDAKTVGVTIPTPVPPATLPADAVTLARRIQQLEDEAAVQNLQHSFGYYFDRKMWDDVADLFASQGTFEVASRGVHVGAARIRQALEAYYGEPRIVTGELFDHIHLSTVVTVAPDGLTAGARSVQLAMIGRNGEFARWEQGISENEYVKIGGAWKLKSLRYFPRLATDYDVGWARDAQAVAAPSAAVPPDRPSSGEWKPYPATRYVGFHFVHPVTGRALRTVAAATVPVPLVRSGRPAQADAGPRTLIALEQRLAAAIGFDAAENLMSSYGYYIDESAWDEMADTYAAAGSKEITGAGVYVGPERIRTVLKLRGPLGGRTPNFFTIHQLTQPVIHVAADGTSAKARLRLFQAGGNADGSSGSWIGGIYENTAVLENGVWKFGVQDLHHIFNASYRNGWARVGAAVGGKPLAGRAPSPRDEQGGGISQGLGGASSANRFASGFPPDRPIRARQYAFPEISEPAFHYRNPVSGREPRELLP